MTSTTQHKFRLSDISRILRNALRDTDEPEMVLQAVKEMRLSLQLIEGRAVQACLDNGLSMTAIAEELGVSRQAVHKRWGHLQAPASAE